ncbi:hypothetical protein Tco_0053168, partial [Tanacetum coccineum]
EIVYPCYKGGVSDFSHEETVVFSELKGAAISSAGKLPALDEYKVVLDVQRSITDAYKAAVYITTLRRHSIVVDKDINEVLLFLSGRFASDGGRMRVAVADNLNVDIIIECEACGSISMPVWDEVARRRGGKQSKHASSTQPRGLDFRSGGVDEYLKVRPQFSIEIQPWYGMGQYLVTTVTWLNIANTKDPKLKLFRNGRFTTALPHTY